MPYYIYRINQGPTAIFKNLECVAEYADFKEAKSHAHQLREELAAGDSSQYKVMFAQNKLQAEEQLMENREKPILREWEK
jgi:hypothetical protein